jgi:hypothetical protein
MIDHRPDTRPPGGCGRGLEQFGAVLAEELEGVAPFNEADALTD